MRALELRNSIREGKVISGTEGFRVLMEYSGALKELTADFVQHRAHQRDFIFAISVVVCKYVGGGMPVSHALAAASPDLAEEVVGTLAVAESSGQLRTTLTRLVRDE